MNKIILSIFAPRNDSVPIQRGARTVKKQNKKTYNNLQ